MEGDHASLYNHPFIAPVIFTASQRAHNENVLERRNRETLHFSRPFFSNTGRTHCLQDHNMSVDARLQRHQSQEARRVL